MVWPSGDPHQLAMQGALLCQDFPGFGSVLPSHFVAGADVTDTARVHGLVAFHFACYGGGTPRDDLYAFDLGPDVPAIAPEPFIAALPRRLLAHPNGGALACIAHVERAWGSSITGVASSPQIRAFQRALANLARRQARRRRRSGVQRPVGHPVRDPGAAAGRRREEDRQSTTPSSSRRGRPAMTPAVSC